MHCVQGCAHVAHTRPIIGLILTFAMIAAFSIGPAVVFALVDRRRA